MLGVYVHLPFCPYLCPYCDFAKWPLRATSADALPRRASRRDRNASRAFAAATIYLGGGTPNAYERRDVADLMAQLCAALSRSERDLDRDQPGAGARRRFRRVSGRRHHAPVYRRAVLRTRRDRDARAQAHRRTGSRRRGRGARRQNGVDLARSDLCRAGTDGVELGPDAAPSDRSRGGSPLCLRTDRRRGNSLRGVARAGARGVLR